MKYDFIIFGGTGQQGSICARDLLESGYSVLLAGRNKERIQKLLKNKNASFIKVDLHNQKAIINAIKQSQADIVINCAEFTFNLAIMKACLQTGKSLTDLGGLQNITQEQFKLHNAFKKAGNLCITGCGSTPGISNIMASFAINNLFDRIETIDLGFAWDSNIKKFVVPYSIESIFEEFTKQPIIFRNGKFIKTKRIVCTGTFNFKEVGKQTSYCIVHSEVYTFPRYFKNKGLKDIHYLAGFPKHSIEKINNLIELGFNSKENIKINGTETSPSEFARKVLGRIKIPKNYKEVENIWVKLNGIKNNRKVSHELNCIVRTQKGWEEAGSNIDTGRTISIISQMLKNKLIKGAGVFAPEALIPPMTFFKELAKRRMSIYLDNKKIN